MSDVFGRRTSTFGRSFSSDDILLTFPQASAGSGFDVPLLLQSLNANYAQQVTQLYDLTTTNVYYIAGKPSGQGQLSQILGPQKLSRTFVETYGQVCNAGRHDLSFTMLGSCFVEDSGPRPPGVSSAGAWRQSQAFTAKFVVITTLQIAMATPQILITNNLGMMFAALEYNDETV